MNNANLNVYGNKSQHLSEAFAAVSAEKIMIIPLDYGKGSFAGQAVRGTGEFLVKQPWQIYNSATGVAFLQNKIQGLCSKYHIDREHVILGGENLPKYVINFVHALRQEGLKFVHVNGTQCQKNRDNRRAKNNNLDLRPIAKTILNRQAQDVREFGALYYRLRQATRERSKFIGISTQIKNRIHEQINILFPGFLDEQQSGITPFSNPSLWLMKDHFSIARIRRRRLPSLVAGLRKHHAQHPEEVARQLQQLAEQALRPPAELVDYLSDSLRNTIALYCELRKAIVAQEDVMARILVQTPGFYLTSIPGIAIVYAATMISEVGAKWYELPPGNILSYGGLIPKETQTGEDDVVKLRLPRDANKILKNAVLQAAHSTGTTRHPAWRINPALGSHRLMEHYQRIEERGGKTNLSTAGLLIRISHRLVNEQRMYVPDGTNWDVTTYFDCVYKSLKEKWKPFDLRGIPEQNNYLSKFKQEIDDATESSDSVTNN